MNVATITMDPELAREKLRAYRKALQTRTDAEYEAAAKGYRALAAGTPLVHLGEVFRACPTDEKGRPRIAIARSDRKQVKLSMREREAECVFDAREKWGESAASLLIKTALGTPLAKTSTFSYNVGLEAFALVPMIPADVRPERFDPQTHFILWEVEQWAEKRIGARPDRDPFLLRHLGGELYAIVAEWDLTDLERAIIAGTRQAK